MLSFLRCAVFCGLVVLTLAQYDIEPPEMEKINPEGLRMFIPDEPGIELFAVHYSINKPLLGTAAGDWNFDINAPTGDIWLHENTAAQINIGDVVNFWHYVLVDGVGHQLLDQSWTVTDATVTPSTVSTTTVSTTTQSTTTQSTTTVSTTPTPSTTTDPNATPGPTTTAPPVDGSDCTEFPCLIFEDNFDSLNFNNWQHEITAGGGGNWEFQYYTNNRSNSYTRDGNLYIKPTLTEDKFGPGFVTSGNLEIWGNTPATECTGAQWYGCQRQGTPDNLANVIQSARLRSVYSFNLLYGKVEINARIPRGDWIWPALWMLPTHEEYGGWPSSGEFDLMESRGNLDLTDASGTQQGHGSASSTMHWGPFFELNSYDRTTYHEEGDFGTTFHKYSVEWNVNEIIFAIDDVEKWRVDPGAGGFWDYGDFANRAPGINNPWSQGTKMAPFDRPFYIIMNVAVGGTNGFFSDDHTNAGYAKPWLNTSPTAPRDFWNARDQWYPTWNPDANNGEDAAMEIDFVRVYKMTQADVVPTGRKAPPKPSPEVLKTVEEPKAKPNPRLHRPKN